MKILLVDDEPFVLKLLAHQLQTLGFKTPTLCESAREALNLFENGGREFDLVFCDLQMPEMDGVEFIRHLGSLGYTGALVLVSGVDDRILLAAEKLAKAHYLHVIGAIQKPISPGRLAELLKFEATQSFESPPLPLKNYDPETLLWAIADGQLVNHYQPKVDLSSGKVIGVEALVRWQHPEDGLVFPDSFITIAEEYDIIDDLTKCVMNNALNQLRHWRESGLSLQVAINISMENLGALNFPDYVARAVEKAGIPLSSVLLEVTEIGLMKNPLASLDILTRLRLKDIALSIDDFGRRDASLTSLHDVPFDELKIDRSFVHGACRDPAISAIYMASLELARQMGMRTVAEGVEDKADWDYVRSSGCNQAQGYFIARPMPVEQLPGWMADWEDRRREVFEYSVEKVSER